MELNSRQRKYLSSHASRLDPVVMLGKEGPSPALVAALVAALEAHELVKLRFIEHKTERQEIARELANSSGSTLVRVIGNVAVYYRPSDEPEKRTLSLPA